LEQKTVKKGLLGWKKRVWRKSDFWRFEKGVELERVWVFIVENNGITACE